MKKFEITGNRMAGKLARVAVCTVLAASMLTGCAGRGEASMEQVQAQENGQTVNSEANATETVSPAEITRATSDFDKSLIEFLNEKGFSEENYMVSPTSFRAALALAIAGADTETRQELINAMGFSSMEEVNAWYASVEEMISDFNSGIKEDQENFKETIAKYAPELTPPDGSLVMLNSIWNNTDLNGKFARDYIKYVQKYYGAEAHDVNSKNITGKVNGFVNKGTNGLIPTISNDLSNANAVLVNTLYLKSGWINSFNDYLTAKGSFTTIKGEKVEKEFMEQQEKFRFYEDEDGKLIVLPLNGGMYAVFTLGEVKEISAALKKATFEDVIVKLPKFEVESSFSENEFIDFLQNRGAKLAFTQDADFSVMCKDTNWMISDIIQKTRIKVDEDGLEAAAATAIMMTEGCLAVEPEQPKEFIADEPFRFYICGGDDLSEVLFYGQVVE